MRYFGLFVLLGLSALSPVGAMAEGNWITAPPPSPAALQAAPAVTGGGNWTPAPAASTDAAATDTAAAAAQKQKDDGTCKAKEGEKEGEGASGDSGKDGGKGENANKCEKVDWPTLTGKDGKGPWTADSVKEQLMQTDPEYAKTLTDADFANMAKDYNNNLSAIGTPESWGVGGTATAATGATAGTVAAQAPSGPWTADIMKDYITGENPAQASTMTDADFQKAADANNAIYAKDSTMSPANYLANKGVISAPEPQVSTINVVDGGQVEVPLSLQYGSQSSLPDFTGGATAGGNGGLFSDDTFDAASYANTGSGAATSLGGGASYSYNDYLAGQNKAVFANVPVENTGTYIGQPQVAAVDTSSFTPDSYTDPMGAIAFNNVNTPATTPAAATSVATADANDPCAVACEIHEDGSKTPIIPQERVKTHTAANSVDAPTTTAGKDTTQIAQGQTAKFDPNAPAAPASTTGSGKYNDTATTKMLTDQALAAHKRGDTETWLAITEIKKDPAKISQVTAGLNGGKDLSAATGIKGVTQQPTQVAAAPAKGNTTPAPPVLPDKGNVVPPKLPTVPVTKQPVLASVVPTIPGLDGLANNPAAANMMGSLLAGLAQSGGGGSGGANAPVTTPDAYGCYYVASGEQRCKTGNGTSGSGTVYKTPTSAVTTANSKGCYFVASGSFVCPQTNTSKLTSDCFKSSGKWMCPSEFTSSYSSEDKASATFKAGYVDGQQGKLIDSTYVNDTTYLQAYYTGQQDRQTLGIQ